MPKDPAAVALGRKGGAATKGITSESKKAASRANAAKAREKRWASPKSPTYKIILAFLQAESKPLITKQI